MGLGGPIHVGVPGVQQAVWENVNPPTGPWLDIWGTTHVVSGIHWNVPPSDKGGLLSFIDKVQAQVSEGEEKGSRAREAEM